MSTYTRVDNSTELIILNCSIVQCLVVQYQSISDLQIAHAISRVRINNEQFYKVWGDRQSRLWFGPVCGPTVQPIKIHDTDDDWVHVLLNTLQLNQFTIANGLLTMHWLPLFYFNCQRLPTFQLRIHSSHYALIRSSQNYFAQIKLLCNNISFVN